MFDRTMRASISGVILCLCLGAQAAGFADDEIDLQSVRNEIEQVRREYEQRLQALENRLKEMESQRRPATNQAPSMPVIVVVTNKPATTEQPLTATATASTNQASSGTPRVVESRQYRRYTESRQRAIAQRQESAFRERFEQVMESFVDITGYFRAGYGVNSKGGPQEGFRAPGAFSKYRLGNEAEIYGELGFGKDFYLPNLFAVDPKERPRTAMTGPIARVQLLMSAYNPHEDLLTASGTDFGLPEAWASVGNILADQRDMKIWAGSRYYRRHDIHISDFFFYNMSGAGGGVEDFTLPFGKAAVAWIGSGASSGFSDLPQPDAENRAGFSKDSLDFRLYDVALPLGSGEFGLVLARSGSGLDLLGRSSEDAEGIAFTALHTREKFISQDGFNKFSLQFGTGPAKTFTSGFETLTLNGDSFIRPDADDSWRFRVTEHFIATLSEGFSIGPALVYQVTDYGAAGDSVHWFSAGVRPVFHLNRYLSLAMEGGIDWVDNEDANTSGYVYKFTIAPQVSLGRSFLSRPVIRVFATHAGWSNDFVGLVGGVDYLNDRRGWTYGMQMEAWW